MPVSATSNVLALEQNIVRENKQNITLFFNSLYICSRSLMACHLKYSKYEKKKNKYNNKKNK